MESWTSIFLACICGLINSATCHTARFLLHDGATFPSSHVGVGVGHLLCLGLIKSWDGYMFTLLTRVDV